MRGATEFSILVCCAVVISTHAPLAGRDGLEYFRLKKIKISTHAPLAGRDVSPSFVSAMSSQFQPTRPLRGATISFLFMSLLLHNFNPRAPCGARQMYINSQAFDIDISTHAPLAGRDTVIPNQACFINISTHAPLAGRDIFPKSNNFRKSAFQPTRPLRGATPTPRPTNATITFQPTRPLRGATKTLLFR